MIIGSNSQLRAFVAEDVKQSRGVSVPIRAGLLRRALVRSASCKKLHPNPNDEFAFPQIGPSFEIIADYERQIRDARKHSQRRIFREPLIVERLRPNGYMLLNGHHRWAAAMKCGLSRVPIRIVNLTQEMDVQRMLQNARHTKRVTLDLDEVVFRPARDALTEKALGFPFNRIYRERLRLGIPALFRFLNTHGYDIWVYSADYDSVDYIRELFRLYHAQVTGIVTGTARKAPGAAKTGESLESRMKTRYPVTIHIDESTVLRIDTCAKTFEEYPLSGPPSGWSAEIMDIIGAMEQHE